MPTPIEPTTSLQTTSALTALLGQLVVFPPRARERGQRYAAAGRVGTLAFNGQSVGTTVRGGESYATEWEWDGSRRWIPSCSCPVGPYCKHAYAVACCVLAESQSRVGFTHPRMSKLLPQHVVLQRALPLSDSPPRVSLPRPARRSSAVDKLRAADGPWEWRDALEQLLARAPVAGLTRHFHSWEGIPQESDPDVRCWRLAVEIQRLADGWLPPGLEPYRDRSDLGTRAAQQARAALARELVNWAQQHRETAQRQLRLVFTLESAPGGQITVGVEARLTTPRLVDAPRTMTQLQQLRNELRRNPLLLAPEQASMLAWLADSSIGGADSYYDYHSRYGTTWRLNGTALKALLRRVSDFAVASRVPGVSIASWATELAPELAARGGVTPGAPVRLRAAPARLLPQCLSRDGEVWVELRFLWPEGSERPLDQVLYFRDADQWSRIHPSLVLADGEFSVIVEEPPASLLDQFRAAGGLPVPGAERPQVLSLLASHFPHLRESLAPHTRLYDVAALVALDLRDDDWMQLRLFAGAAGEAEAADWQGWQPGRPVPPGAIVFEYQPDGRWARPAAIATSAPADARPTYDSIDAGDGPAAATAAAISDNSSPVAGADVWLEAPNPQAVEPVMAWLAGTHAASGLKRASGGHAPTWPDRDVGWWLQASPRRMAAFAEAWEQRPGGVLFFGTPRIRRLLSGQDRVTPRLHIESSGVEWFSVSAEWEAEGLQLSDADLAKLRAATTRFVRLPSGWVRRDVAAVHEEMLEVLGDLGIEPGQGTQRLSLWQLAGAKPENLAALEHLGADAEAFRAVAALRARIAAFTGLPRVPPPPGLIAALRPYQLQGLDFLVHATSLGIGAVLADDMGLGKTVQALAWLEHLRVAAPDGGPSLVVCPASVVHNWAREAARFVPGLRVLLLTSGQTRHALRREIPRHDLIVTNYALLRRDIAAWREIELRAAILDEAQNIKNPDAAVTKAALELRARHRLALTGTPLENRALDLWSILQFVNPGYLGHRAQFSARFDRLDAPPHARTLLAAKLRPVLLRRMKHEVAPELPDRIEERQDCELTAGQRQLYLAELRRSRALVETLSAAPGGVTHNKIVILAALTRLRQICCHPALAGGKADLGSGKFDVLFELLEPLLAEGHKVLLFSQFVQCLKLLSVEMRHRAIAQHMLTGQSVKREQIVARFQEDPDPCVFLISLKAGGTGLNLTAASYVVLFDPWWNPAVEAQAIDRTHRIGQDHTVIAYRMLAVGTIEEKIWELQQRKAALARDVLGEDGFARSLTRNDLTYLLADA